MVWDAGHSGKLCTDDQVEFSCITTSRVRRNQGSTAEERCRMHVARVKPLAALVGMAAIGVAIAVNLGPTTANLVAGGSGDSSTVGEYTSPTVPAMSVNPTAMSLGATATASPPKATMVTSEATPTLKASPAPE